MAEPWERPDTRPYRREQRPVLETELRRFLATQPLAERRAAERGFRAGWERLARVARPLLVDAEASWWRAVSENEQLRSRIGVLLTRLSQLEDRG